jgi:hypothetical protein
MRLRHSRRQGSPVLAIVGACLGIYVVLAVAFHWLVEPTLAKSREAAASKPPPATAVGYRAAALAAYARSTPPSPVASTPPVTAKAPASAAVAAADAKEQAAEVPKKAAKKQAPATTARHERSPLSFVSGLFNGREQGRGASTRHTLNNSSHPSW